MGIIVLNLGKETGTWEAMKGGEPVTPAQLAKKSNLSERYLEELLRAGALHGYVQFLPGGVTKKEADWDSGMEATMDETYSLSSEMEEVLFDSKSPNYYGHEFSLPMFLVGKPFEKLVQAFKDDTGVPYSLYGEKFPNYVEMSHKNIYQTQIKEWLRNEELVDLRKSLVEGGVVLDLGCGNGWSSISVAEEFPNSKVHAVDLDEVSIDNTKANVADAVSKTLIGPEQIIPHCCFAHEADIPTGSVDLAMLFICLHDMHNPSEVLKSTTDLLKPDGTILVLEFTNPDSFSEAFESPVSKFCMSASVLHCLPVAKVETPSQAVGTCFSLKTMMKVAEKAGFTRVISFKANDMMTLFVIRK